MNSKQAKQLSLPEIMSRLGYEPVKVVKDGRELWYESPFRSEKEPSFHTSYLGGKWIWNDFGDQGGTVIDFILRHENYTLVKDALSFLENMFQGHLFETPTTPNSFSFQQQISSRAAASSFSITEDLPRQLEFIEAHSIQNPIIYTYLKGRGIPKELADNYLVEVKYWNHNKPGSKHKPFFAFGMKNEAGGYEIRSASDQYSFKSALIARDISRIPGRVGEREAVSVFEGMTDFLSLLVMTGTDQLKGDAIIMHSLSSFHQAVSKIQDHGYSRINLFLDNNPAGQKATTRFVEEFGDCVFDFSPSFSKYVDLNEALKDRYVPVFSSLPNPPQP
jgi:hypothetical protein